MQLPWDSKSRPTRSSKMEGRERSADLYHTYRWTRLSASFRAYHPVCEECRRRGLWVSAEVVDHKTPWPICGEDGFFDMNNLQSLCQACNIAKGNQDKKLIREWRKSHPLNQ